MKRIRLACLSGVLAFRALFSWNTPGLFVTVIVLTPLLQVVFFVLLGQALDYQDPLFFIIGSAVQGATAASVSGLVGVIAEERGFGTLAHLLVSPASRTAVFVGRLLPGVLIALGVTVLTSTIGFVVVAVDVSPAQYAIFLAAVLAASFAGSALGLALSSFGLVYRDIYQVSTVAQIVLLIVTGATVAVVDLPRWVQLIAQGLPLTHAIAAAREVIGGAGDVTTAWTHVGLEVLVGIAWLAAGLVFARVMESISRRGGGVDLS